tara:strand:- start:1159 stop:1296 length:138 start_codon:yes stop_codon:yes gene_type:complete
VEIRACQWAELETYLLDALEGYWGLVYRLGALQDWEFTSCELLEK